MTMPTAEATLLAAGAWAMWEEMEPLLISGGRGQFHVHRAGSAWDEPKLFVAETPALCRAWIAERAFAAGLRVLAESEPTEAMRKAWSDVDMLARDRITGEWRAMLGALLEER